MIRLSIGAALDAAPAINELLQQAMPVKTAYAFARIAKRINDELSIYEQARVRLVHELGEELMTEAPDPGDAAKTRKFPTGTWQVTPGNRDAYDRQIGELHAVEIEIDAEPVRLEALGEDFTVKPAVLIRCASLIVDG